MEKNPGQRNPFAYQAAREGYVSGRPVPPHSIREALTPKKVKKKDRNGRGTFKELQKQYGGSSEPDEMSRLRAFLNAQIQARAGQR